MSSCSIHPATRASRTPTRCAWKCRWVRRNVFRKSSKQGAGFLVMPITTSIRMEPCALDRRGEFGSFSGVRRPLSPWLSVASSRSSMRLHGVRRVTKATRSQNCPTGELAFWMTTHPFWAWTLPLRFSGRWMHWRGAGGRRISFRAHVAAGCASDGAPTDLRLIA